MPSTLRRWAPVVLAVASAVVIAVALAAPRDAAPRLPAATGSPTAGDATSSPSSDVAREVGVATVVQGFGYGRPRAAATADQNQTKLWYAHDRWWAVMLDPRTASQRIFALQDDGVWRNTNTLVDEREASYADAVLVGDRLTIGSRASDGELIVRHYTWAAAQEVWAPTSVTPAVIAEGGASSLSVAVDSTGRTVAVWVAQGRVWWSTSDRAGTAWGAAEPVPGPNQVLDDDIAAVSAYDGQVAIMWSDQVSGAFRFASRDDDEPAGTLDVEDPVLTGIRIADGHVRLLPSPDGRLYAAVKTSLGDSDVDAPDSPLLVVLTRNLDGSWDRTTAATTQDQMTRPQILLSEDGSHLYFVATSPQTGGALYLKVSDTDPVSFAPGRGTPLLAWDGAVVNNGTVTRQPVHEESGVVVLASDSAQARYYHAEMPLLDAP